MPKSQICINPHIWKMSNKGRGVREFLAHVDGRVSTLRFCLIFFQI
jgi:hypothetical protein